LTKGTHKRGEKKTVSGVLTKAQHTRTNTRTHERKIVDKKAHEKGKHMKNIPGAVQRLKKMESL
jgi:hypothetical protein